MDVWHAFLQQQEKLLSKETVDLWLRPLKVVDFDACNLYLEAQDSFQLAWFEEHIRPKLKSLRSSSGRPIKVHLTQGVDAAAGKKPAGKKPSKGKFFCPPLKIAQDTLDPSALLEEFVITPANEMVLKCAQELVSSTEKTHMNPLFIYGESGAGKSHLLMALAATLQKKGLRVFFVRAESFTAHVVAAIRNGAMQEFRKAYRHVDVLIIDDVHHFASKNATQEELFHTFNALHGSGKQIVLSAQIAPHLMRDIEPRLVSRFEWGLLLRLEHLDATTVHTWLMKRAAYLNLNISQDTGKYLVDTFHGRTLSLARALQALTLRAHFSKKTRSLDQDEVAKLLQDLIDQEKKKEVNAEKIIHAAANYYGMRADDLLGKSQAKEAALPRQMAMYLCRNLLKLPYMKIGQIFCRDHSTVMTSVKQVEAKLSAQEKDSCLAKEEISKTLM